MKFTRTDVRWARLTWETIFPDDVEAELVGFEHLDIDKFLDELAARTPWRAVLALKIAFLVCMVSPLLTLGRFTTLASLTPELREKALYKLLYHPNYFLRQLVAVLKGAGALLYAAHPANRERITATPKPLLQLVRSPSKIP
jgi:hypothetical protein